MLKFLSMEPYYPLDEVIRSKYFQRVFKKTTNFKSGQALAAFGQFYSLSIGKQNVEQSAY